MKRLLIALSLLLLSTSATAQVWKDIIKDPGKIKKGAKVFQSATKEFSEDEEANIGRVVSARILATYPLVENERLQKYVTLVGQTVASYSTRPTLDWHFSVIKAPYVNAFAAPGGFVFITSAAMDNIHSEAELAAVLGHEVGHVTQKHILREIKRASFVSAGVDFASSAAGGGGLTDEMGKKIADLAYEKLFTKGLGRGDELESDGIGVQLASEAGYRQDSMVTFLQTLEKLEGADKGGAMKQLAATHPPTEDRITAVKSKITNPAAGALLADRYATWTKPKK